MQHICAVALHDGQMYSIVGGSGGIVYNIVELCSHPHKHEAINWVFYY